MPLLSVKFLLMMLFSGTLSSSGFKANADEPIKILAQAAAELPPLDADVNINYNICVFIILMATLLVWLTTNG